VKPVTVQWGGRVDSRDRRQASVMDEVPLGFMRRILMVLFDDPVTDGRGKDSVMSKDEKGEIRRK
jgi:hypothetical protein